MKQRTTWPSAWLTVACVALGFALLSGVVPLQRRMTDLIIVFDITQSMNVMDMILDEQPVSRLSYAKRVFARAVARLPCGSRVGLAIFTEYRSFLLFAPIETCENRRELLDSLARIDGRMAWAGDSQIAKGLFSAMTMAGLLQPAPAIAFVTDGHEAPPINPRHRPEFPGVLGAVDGVILGVGGGVAQAIPKVNPDGEPAGVWRADEVLQKDLYAIGRQGNETHESMAELEPDVPVSAALAATPGTEHLSALHDAYLELLASENGLGYQRLGSPTELRHLLAGRALTHARVVPTDVRWLAALTALCALLAKYLRPIMGK